MCGAEASGIAAIAMVDLIFLGGLVHHCSSSRPIAALPRLGAQQESQQHLNGRMGQVASAMKRPPPPCPYRKPNTAGGFLRIGNNRSR